MRLIYTDWEWASLQFARENIKLEKTEKIDGNSSSGQWNIAKKTTGRLS